MKELKLNKKSWHSSLYKSAYNAYKLPEDICSYFWKLVLAIILYIPAWPGHLMNWMDNKWKTGANCAANYWAVHIAVALLCNGVYMEKGDKLSIWWYPIGMGIGIAILAAGIVLICIIGAIIWVMKKIEDKRNSQSKKPDTPNVLVEGWKAWKGKYCEKITWQ